MQVDVFMSTYSVCVYSIESLSNLMMHEFINIRKELIKRKINVMNSNSSNRFLRLNT